MVEHGSTAYNTLLRSEHIVTDNESSSSEGASEGDTNKRDGYNADKDLPMSDKEGVKSSKQSPHSTHTHTCDQVHDQVHACLQMHADYAQIITVELPQADLLRWHYRLGHFSFKPIKAME